MEGCVGKVVWDALSVRRNYPKKRELEKISLLCHILKNSTINVRVRVHVLASFGVLGVSSYAFGG